MQPPFYNNADLYKEVEMNNNLFKLVTRRWIAWPLIAIGLIIALFLVVYGAVTRQTELATLGAGAIFAELGTVTGFYFAKKINEE